MVAQRKGARWRLAWLLGALALASGCDGGDGLAEARLRGRVVTVTGQLVPGASIILDGEALGGVASDFRGEFFAPQVAPGEYTITASAPFLTFPSQVVVVPEEGVAYVQLAGTPVP
jgi:hypothetical protein